MVASDQVGSTGAVGLEQGQEGKGGDGREGSPGRGNRTSSGMEAGGRSAHEVE